MPQPSDIAHMATPQPPDTSAATTGDGDRPTAPTGPEPAVRRAVRGLRREQDRRIWGSGASRPLPARPVFSGFPQLSAEFGASSDVLAGLLAQLREVTTRYVCALRAEGARPEQVLPPVKALVREAMTAEGWHDPEAAQVLTAQVVRWSIDAYYDG